MFDLPDPGRYELAAPPLRQAHAEVRFPLVAKFQTLEGVAPVQNRLRDRFPYMQRRDTAEMGVVIGPSGPKEPQVATATTWEMTNDEGTLVSIGPGSATLSAGPEYVGVEWFAEQFDELLGALADSGDVRRCDRVGVRYINVADAPPGEPRAWRRWFKPEVVGWAAQDVFADATVVLTSLNQMAVTVDAAQAFPSFPGDVQGVIRNGLVQANSVVPGIPQIQLDHEAFVLDIDAFVAAPQPFSPSAIVEQFRTLHSEIDKFFRWAVSEEGAKQFGLEEVSA